MESDVLQRILDGREKPTNLPLALLKNITVNFSKEREIGHGGFATVYKGVLSNGNVAVKRIRNNHTIDERLFYREVNSLMAINHQNVVRFVGFCASTDQTAIKIEGSREYIYAEIRERLLCFEYISNGSLQKYITDELRGLDWSTRYRLIKRICDGLHYLHMEKHIYHMDLKPANILLDNEMVPKITDFGLSRLDEKSQTMSVDRCGSLGYCAPEYLQRGKMSFKSDIYSLGIIIIELVTGEKSIPDNNKNNVLRRWSHRWKKTGNESPLCYQQVTKCIDIGLLCQEIDPCKRPFISEIINDISKMECTTGEISISANESTFGPINSCLEDDMLGIEPLELHFPFEINTQMSCSLQLTNETNSYIAFNIQKTRPLPYCTHPHTDIVPPRSKCGVNITLQPQDKAPRDMQHANEFIVRSTRVNDGIAVEDITTEMFNKETNNAVDEVNLDVVFDAQLQSELLDVLNSVQQADCEIQKGPHENPQSFPGTVDPLFSSNGSYSSSDRMISHVDGILFKALVKMEGEFQYQLSQRSKSMEPGRIFDCLISMLRQSSESQSEGGKHPSAGAQSNNQEAAVYSPPALIEPKFVPLLAKLARQWVKAGFQQECAEIYSEARASALEVSLKILGVKKLSKGEVQKMPWEILESKIGNWIHFMRIAVKLLFAGERQLCYQVFECSQSLRDKCFSAITKNSLATLLSFGEAIAMSKRSPEKLFVLLDMYGMMCELQMEIDTIFVGESCSQMHDSTLSLRKCLAQTAQKTLSDFEEAVEKDAAKYIITDGTVHPLTNYVMNYVKVLFDYQSTLKHLFLELKRHDGTGSELASVTISIIQALQNNLDSRAKQYQDPALMHIFLMNNNHHIVNSIIRSDAKDLLGDDWIQTHRRIVVQNANQYKRVAWAKAFQCLSRQDWSLSGGSSLRTDVKDRFRSFNVLFDENYQKQRGWSVPDSELRESLRLAVAEVMLPAYRSFQKRFGPLIENRKAREKYVKHTPEQLELLLGNLFEGKQECA